MKCDVLLMTDVFRKFQKFKSLCLEYQWLFPCCCFWSPELSWDAMLKTEGVHLELASDVTWHQFMSKQNLLSV